MQKHDEIFIQCSKVPVLILSCASFRKKPDTGTRSSSLRFLTWLHRILTDDTKSQMYWFYFIFILDLFKRNNGVKVQHNLWLDTGTLTETKWDCCAESQVVRYLWQQLWDTHGQHPWYLVVPESSYRTLKQRLMCLSTVPWAAGIWHSCTASLVVRCLWQQLWCTHRQDPWYLVTVPLKVAVWQF